MATEAQRDLIDAFMETFPDVHTVEDTMRMCFQLKEDRDRWRNIAKMFYDRHENRRNCSLLASCKQCDEYEKAVCSE